VHPPCTPARPRPPAGVGPDGALPVTAWWALFNFKCEFLIFNSSAEAALDK
jgi:hypothetical protein